MHKLCINDEHGQSHKWWFNFMCSLDTGDDPGRIYDLNVEFGKWGARLDDSNAAYCDTIIFENEEDMTWFLLRWS